MNCTGATQRTVEKAGETAISRDHLRIIKESFHLGSQEDRVGESPDGYRKIHLLIKHIQNQFTDLFVPEQNL
jgi:hypothetical protein